MIQKAEHSFSHEQGHVNSCWTVNHSAPDDGGDYVSEDYLSFPGPLLSNNLDKDQLVDFIQRKSQAILQHEPEQKEAYFFWELMELFCSSNRKVLMAEIATCLIKADSCLKMRAPKLVRTASQDNWCLRLAQLLYSVCTGDEIRRAVIKMAADLVCRGQLFASHICCVVAQLELGSYQDGSFDLIGCKRLPFEKASIRESIERSEVYEYALFKISGTSQASFQKYKGFHAKMLFREGHPALALDYCESIARAIFTSPLSNKVSLTKQIILMSKKLVQWTAKYPEWLLNLGQLYKDQVHLNNQRMRWLDALENEGSDKLPQFQLRYVTDFMQLPVRLTTTTKDQSPSSAQLAEALGSRYIIGDHLGKGGFGSVFAGVCKADGKKVAIKYAAKTSTNEYITIPGETDRLPLEVALMKIVSVPPVCENIVELVEWMELPSGFIIVLERPSHCMDLQLFCKFHKRRMPEPLTRYIMQQVVQAVRHCFERGVLHSDIKPANLLINTLTLQVKVIDFGCGSLLNDLVCTSMAGTPAFWPPEWVLKGQYTGRPATIWSLGVLMYYLVAGDFPFKSENETACLNLQSLPDVSPGCQRLIWSCLQKEPNYRATLEDISSDVWFKGELQENFMFKV